jgi:uncharacterized radical SAM superfamily protein
MQAQIPPAPDSAELSRQFQSALEGDPHRWRAARQVREAHFPSVIRFARPTLTVPVSLTGKHCALNCAHCGGHYLQHMHAITDLPEDGIRSLLISGGCDPLGRVPVSAQIATVAHLHAKYKLNWHVGLIDEATMRCIAPYVDTISFDVVGDAETAREVYGLDLGLADYMDTFDMASRYARVVPHLTIGLRAGRLSGEYAALQALRQRVLPALVFIVLIPTAGTAYAQCSPPALDDVTDVFLQARELLPATPLYLGCMRPHGKYRQAVDELAVRAGLNTIVNPTRVAGRMAAELGLWVEWSDECCGLS